MADDYEAHRAAWLAECDKIRSRRYGAASALMQCANYSRFAAEDKADAMFPYPPEPEKPKRLREWVSPMTGSPYRSPDGQLLEFYSSRTGAWLPAGDDRSSIAVNVSHYTGLLALLDHPYEDEVKGNG